MTADLRSRLQITLGNAFSVERELRGGGMSQVFVALENRLGRRVVVKVLRREIAAGASGERFEREMAFSARCNHPHIVPLLTTGEVDGLPYFTMPLIEGESLRDRLVRGDPMPIADVIKLLREVADALAYAHRLGVVHRDIKPENILFQDGHALVADFGVAKALYAATEEAGASTGVTGVGTVIGTAAYMAPEQALGDPGLDHRADLYALGVVGYEILAGKPPFSGTSIQALLSAQITTHPAPLSRARPDCPEELAALIERLLAKEPGRRPQTAEEVLTVLQRVGPGPVGGRNRRNRWLGVGALVVLGAVTALLVTRPRGGGPPHATAPAVSASLAVLPFDNIGGDSTTNYFSDGMSEELISALGRHGGLRVASRTSAFAARAKSGDVREIGQRLSVAVVLEGSVRRDGDRVRVIARLVDVARDSQLWVGEYDNRLENVFAVQDTIARAIASALKITLTGGETETLVERGTTNPESHLLYLRGRYFLANRKPVAIRKAISMFQAALALDSNYARAYAGLADAYSLGVPFGDFSPAEAFPPAKAAAHRALVLDSTLAEVHVSLGIIAMFNEWDWPEAERRLTRALELNPSQAQARLFHAWYLLLTERPDEARREIERARDLDPLSLIINTRLASFLHFAGRNDEAILAYRHALEFDSTFAWARAGLGLSYALVGRFKEALASLPRPEEMAGNFEVGEIAVAQALAQRPDLARKTLAELTELRKHRYVGADAFAAGYVALGETNAAFAELERAFKEHSFTLSIDRVEPLLAPLHKDPRWADLMHRVNFP